MTDDLLGTALDVVRRHLAPTPLVEVDLPGIDRPVRLKLESLQPSGSFKVRGALAALTAYATEGRPVVTASAGNHALGVAHAARLTGARAIVVVPENASSAKVAALRDCERTADVEVRLAGRSYEEAEAAALALAEAGHRYVSAYNDPWVIVGQGSIVAELSQQQPGGGTVVVPVGGGGLAAGCGLAAAATSVGWQVVGVEAARSTAVSAAVAVGAVVPVEVGDTIADGLAGNIEPGCVTPGLVAASGVRLARAEEPAIRTAVAELARHGIVAEGSAAVTLAALRAGLVPGDDPVVLVITGRNIAPDLLARLITEG